ncbi:hypothetical protein [Planctomyces sp. SH-PL62]|uniref:hypothetical protein n=1 Tax=Planctomyces sp. SH-PL62 TaxID=1636152 RepID=UPI00078B60E2|nr:hypothetical protein [Planctomyces sp. SH-PL62]AMV35869.1 hypothetical protein VT85_00395 [Planctomyces sp. SH-PL62]
MRQDIVRSIGRSEETGPSRRPRASSRSRALAAGALVALGWSTAGPALPLAHAQIPGPELFAQQPKTPEELWGAIDYLSRTGQGRQAVPYLETFSQAEVDDATLLKLRDKYGPGSFLRLDDDPATKPFAKPLTDKLNAAARRMTADPERIRGYIPALLASKEEQDYAVARLRESGPFAVPAIVAEIKKYGPTAPERGRLIHNAGRLDTSSVPAWIAALDSPDPLLAADVAGILGDLADSRAVPFLTFPAAWADSPIPVKTAAALAIEKLTGKPFANQPRSPVNTLDDAAESLARHQYEMPGERVLLWRWDEAQGLPAPVVARQVDVEGIFGGKLAGQALQLEPANRRAQVVQLGFLLERAIDKVGFANFPAQDQETYAEALAAGPEVLADLLRGAIATSRVNLAAVTAEALGKVADPSLPSRDGRPHPLVEALSAPGRRLQLAAARAIVDLSPTRAFPGSSRVVPTLARFLLNQSRPRAVVIDGNPARGAQVAGALRGLGYEANVETSGERGFQSATESADVEMILTAHDHASGSWDLLDILSILRSDARTSPLPLFVYGPSDLEARRPNLARNYPGVKFVVYTATPEDLERQIGGRPSKLSDEERMSQAKAAAETLARIAARPRSLFAPDLAAARETLSSAIGLFGVEGPIAETLGEIPSPQAQRALADAILDGSRDPALRRDGARRLARSIQRFGPMLAPDQEVKLSHAFQSEDDADLHTGLGMVLGALRRTSRESEQRPANLVPGGAAADPTWAPAAAPAAETVEPATPAPAAATPPAPPIAPTSTIPAPPPVEAAPPG